MAALDTIACGGTPGIGTTIAATPATGDSLQLRAFPTGAKAWLEDIAFQGAVQANIRSFDVRSPRLHDNVSGLTVAPGELVAASPLPDYAAQSLYSSDTLVAEITGGAAGEFQEMALFIYYEQLGSNDVGFLMPSDVQGNLKSLKSFQTVVGAAAANAWSDTGITTTDNQLHADARYAVMGYATNTLMTAVGVRGQDTANLRACGPGITDERVTSDYFAFMSVKTGRPHIPVIQANNRGGTSVSCISRAAIAGTERVTLHLAELTS
jgi:hypothetical protein